LSPFCEIITLFRTAATTLLYRLVEKRPSPFIFLQYFAAFDLSTDAGVIHAVQRYLDAECMWSAMVLSRYAFSTEKIASDAVEADSRILPFAGIDIARKLPARPKRELDGSSPTKKQ
jgi:hypothetical protein